VELVLQLQLLRWHRVALLAHPVAPDPVSPSPDTPSPAPRPLRGGGVGAAVDASSWRAAFDASSGVVPESGKMRPCSGPANQPCFVWRRPRASFETTSRVCTSPSAAAASSAAFAFSGRQRIPLATSLYVAP